MAPPPLHRVRPAARAGTGRSVNGGWTPANRGARVRRRGHANRRIEGAGRRPPTQVSRRRSKRMGDRLLSTGGRLGRYRVVSPLGAGGMGEVYRAVAAGLGREVAIKVLSAESAHDPDRLRRFAHEARAVAALSHPNVLALHDVGSQDGVDYAVFELLEGRTLRQRLEGGPLPPGQALDYGVQMSEGPAAIHERGMVHRDLKPGNGFLTRSGQVKILASGLGKPARPWIGTEPYDRRVSTATHPGLLVGTSGYMAPEQARGRSADARSDIFALGSVLYEMLSGRRAFAGETAADTLAA